MTPFILGNNNVSYEDSRTTDNQRRGRVNAVLDESKILPEEDQSRCNSVRKVLL